MAWNKSGGEQPKDMKSVLVNTAEKIGNRVYDVTMSNDNPNIRGWTSEIETFEAQMSPYLDQKYFDTKKDVLKKLYEKQKPSRRQLFKAWLYIYSLLCMKMQSYGAYPLTPIEEVQEHEHPEYIFEDEDVEVLPNER